MKKQVHIVSYTHWDREFRWEFEQTRMKLVSCFDHLLEIMKSKPEYKSFLMDGQVGLLDDYLEIRPEQEGTIRDLVKAGRLEIGPWFSLPDCGTINGESVVRNLQYGVKVSQGFGDVLRCGYNVFSFGQIAQLPQIYSHFGIDIIIFYKYMNPVRSRLPEFIWEAPDGTRAFASRLGREARWNFFFAGHIPIVYDRDPWNKEWRYDYGTLGKVFHPADPEGYGWFHEIQDPETSFHPENIKKGFERTIETVRGTAAPNSLLFFDGTDFTEPHPLTPEIIKAMQEQCGGEYDIKHSTLGAYLGELKASLNGQLSQLQVVKGPMRDGPVGSVHSDVLTTHPEIKLINARTENCLVRYAEPLSAMVYALGIDRYPATYLSKAWKLLFQSHAHDSVHGLGPRELAEGGVARLQQAGLVAQGLERVALGNLTKEIKTDATDGTVFLAVHNTAAFARSEVVEAWVDVPAEVVLDQVVIKDTAGRACPVQEISREKTRGGIYHPRSRNMPFYCTRVHLLFWADEVPAMGYKTFNVGWVAKRDYPYPHEDWDAPKIVMGDLLTGPRQARNEHMALAIRPDGTFAVTDLAGGRVYEGLNSLLDSGDRGNMWMSDSPDQDVIVQSVGGQAAISCIQHGPLSVRFRIEVAMDVPARYDFTKQVRSDERVTLSVVTELTLRKGSRYVEVTSTVNNTARDHYLKLCFPTGLAASVTAADGSFSVTEYSTAPDLSCELARHPAQLWFDTGDGKDGLAVLSRSTKDYEILDEGGLKTMAMGLVRGTRLRIPCDNRLWMDYPGDESSQSLGETVHQYAILPHRSTWREAGLYEDALRFNQPLKACQFGRQDGRLPLVKSLVSIENRRLVLSAVKKAEDRNSVLVRLFNPTQTLLSTGITVGFGSAKAYQVTMAESRVSALDLKGDRAEVLVGPGQIVTVEFER